MIDVNIKGVPYRIAAALPYMKRQQAGHFINVFSVAGHTDSASAQRIRKFYQEIAIPAESFARAVAFAMTQPEDVDVNEILFRPTRQEL
jgi:NADP-dependent 3-hydroxy acid dehydrogenase YdfG